MMDTARQAIFERIRSAHALKPAADGNDSGTRHDAIPRGYRRSGSLHHPECVDLFAHRLKEYEAGVYYAATENIAIAVKEILIARDKQNIVVSAGLPAAWLPEGFAFTIGDELTANDLDRFDGVLTGSTVAIALTGSIVLQGVAGQGTRRLSLIPDYHLCVVFAEQIVETVPEAFDRLASTATLPTTFISGPSATADIEMTRIKGVHGPRFLDVLIVGDKNGICGREELRSSP
ncbi:MAG: LUD domain-containing protein [Acidobacteriaceae bacterium]